MPDLGDTLRFKSDVYDGAGALTTPQTAVLTVTLPDGTTDTPSVSNPTAGKYYADYVTTTQSGRYVGQWLFTFSGGKTTSYVETFDVGASLVTVDEAVAHLRAVGVITSEADFDQLHWLTLVATDAVEKDLGRVLVRRSVTETYSGGGAIILRSSPVISVTSVAESGVSLGSEFLANLSAGILYRGSSYSARAFGGGYQNVTVTYVAGYTNPPRVARMVALGVIQSLWQSSQQAAHPLIDESGMAGRWNSASADMAIQSSVMGLPDPLRSAYESLRAVVVA